MLNAATFADSELKPTALSRSHAATRLAALILGLVTSMIANSAILLALLVVVTLGLTKTGLGLKRQLASARPWWPMIGLMLTMHVFTTVSGAPLGHPSWLGLSAGLHALARVVVSVGLLGFYLRIATLDELIAGTGWWLEPLRRLGVPVADFGLMLAVAMGTAPAVLSEGRRIEMVRRLRRAGPEGQSRSSKMKQWIENLIDRAQLVVPLLETMARRAEAMNLSLRRRRPASTAGPRNLPAIEWLFLATWVALLWWRPW
ncbi:MAG: energy-coupling factor transporter transmembrane protein EcfT [Candidatus Krumholzibacteriia bacterium]|jgi:energy-coupling factor transporter transmembrane protein EcfT